MGDPLGSPGELLGRVRAGDDRAWAALTDRFTPLLWSIARGMGLSTADAADAVQTTWLRLVEHLDSVRDPERIGGWLATTARNECRLLSRQRQRVRVGLGDDLGDDLGGDETGPSPGAGAPGDAPEPDAALLRRERITELRAAFTQLGQRCQQLLRVLIAEPRPTIAEAAAALGMPPGSVVPTRQRCLRKLASLLGPGRGGRDV